MKRQGMRVAKIIICVSLTSCLMCAGCSQSEQAGTQGTDEVIIQDESGSEISTSQGDSAQVSTAATNPLKPSDLAGYRKISEDLPKAGETVKNPGTREHFSFVEEGQEYEFTETESLWLYNQSRIGDLHTEFMLNIKGNKVTIVPLSSEERKELDLSKRSSVFSGNGVTIYQGMIPDTGKTDGDSADGDTDTGKAEGNSADGDTDAEKAETNSADGDTDAGKAKADSDGNDPNAGKTDGDSASSDPYAMYLTVYDMVYLVDGWQDLLRKGMIDSESLFHELSQMGTAIQKDGAASDNKDSNGLSDVLAGYRSLPVYEDYYLAYRDGMSHSGFVYCCPNTNKADHDQYVVYLSVYLPDWDTYAVLHVEPAPENTDSLENAGVEYDGHPLLADYTGSLKYYLVGDSGRCVYLEGTPGEGGSSDKAYTAKEAAYIFDLVFTK